MAQTQYGTTLITGVQTVAGFVVESAEIGDYEVVQEDVVEGVVGTIATRIIKARYPKLVLNLVSASGSTAITLFPKGLKATHTGSYTSAGLTITLSSCICEDVKVGESSGGQRVTVTLINIGV